jgi:hypothetical protein
MSNRTSLQLEFDLVVRKYALPMEQLDSAIQLVGWPKLRHGGELVSKDTS